MLAVGLAVHVCRVECLSIADRLRESQRKTTMRQPQAAERASNTDKHNQLSAKQNRFTTQLHECMARLLFPILLLILKAELSEVGMLQTLAG